MNIEPQDVSVAQLFEGFIDSAEEGVRAFGGRLDIRPPYQREFIYKDKQRNAVIDTVLKHFPLNVMYWAVRDDGNFEVIDGQQRTLSICQFVNGDFSIDGMYFSNLQDDQQRRILDYVCKIYLCSGSPSEKLDWFKTINIAGEEHTEQEIRNAVYAGPWTADAKRYFSKTGCAAYGLAGAFLKGVAIRQDYLETAIAWHAHACEVNSIEEYMGRHQHDENASPLWQYFQRVIAWVTATFPNYRQEMKGVGWGPLYNNFKDAALDADELEDMVAGLMMNEDVQRKPGIYSFVLDGDDRHLNIRAFSQNMKREAYERQQGICVRCEQRFEFEEMEGDHIMPWHEGGQTIAENCQMLCRADNRRKSGR